MKKSRNNYQLLQPKVTITELDKPHPVFLHKIAVNPYTNCSYGCQYCYAIKDEEINQPYSPRIGVKTNIVYCLKRTLKNIDSPVPVALGTLTDPYQPAEKEFQISRHCLEIIVEKQFPLQIFTKSDLIMRDANILSKYSQKGFCTVMITIPTLEEKLKNKLEPNAPKIEQRLNLISQLREKNILCGILLAPIIPYVNDEPKRLDQIFYTASKIGAEYLIPGGLVLGPEPAKKRMMKLLTKHFGKIAHRYEALYGKDTMPGLTYSNRIMGCVKELSAKYKLPLNLPVRNAKPVTNIRIEPLR
jgi:DNA repair photolyase